MTCSSIFFDAEEKHKNTQNTKRVAPVLCGPHHTFTTKPKKYKKINPTKQVFSIAFLHIYTRVLKSTKIHNG